MTRACLSADVLISRYLREVLLALADSSVQLYKPVWSEGELKRFRDGLAKQIGPESADSIVADLKAYWDDSIVEPDQELAAKQLLPNPEWNELLATALAGQADTLVTSHPGDFPSQLLPPGVASLSADEFLTELLHMKAEEVCQIMAGWIGQATDELVDDYLAGLKEAGAGRFVYELTEYKPLDELEAMADEYRTELRRGGAQGGRW